MSYDALAAWGISQRGEALTLIQTTPGTYSDSTRTYSGGSDTNTAITGFVAPYKSAEIDGDAIKQGDLQCWVAAYGLTVTPAAGNHVQRGSTVYRVESVDEPAGPSMVYVLQLRGAE